ncbi:hypothetical protein [uncultured Phocaeicola sp.]|uniref:hypothetical protein n=1 Tax=uncultured Phocaeicola sp. TaxID=990718 RepID=UPI002670B32F|nr:hypothetical protein [uncultured Phocaeicola sp.]
MVRFDMLYYKEIGTSAIQGIVEFGQPVTTPAYVHRINYGYLFIKNEIGIVGNTFTYGVLPFKKIEIVIFDPNKPYIWSDL